MATVSCVPASSSLTVTTSAYRAGSSALHGRTSRPVASSTSPVGALADQISFCSASPSNAARTLEVAEAAEASTRSRRLPLLPSCEASGIRSMMCAGGRASSDTSRNRPWQHAGESMRRTAIAWVCVGCSASVTSKAVGMKPSAQKPTNIPSTHAYSGPVKPPKVSVIIQPRSAASLRGASRMNSRRRIEARTRSGLPWSSCLRASSSRRTHAPSISSTPGTDVASKSR